jgi:hypothetical protein
MNPSVSGSGLPRSTSTVGFVDPDANSCIEYPVTIGMPLSSRESWSGEAVNSTLVGSTTVCACAFVAATVTSSAHTTMAILRELRIFTPSPLKRRDGGVHDRDRRANRRKSLFLQRAAVRLADVT